MEIMNKQDLMQIDELLQKRLGEQDARIDEKFAEQDRRIDEKFAAQDARIDEKFAAQDARIDEKFAEQDARIDEKFKEQNHYFVRTLNRMSVEQKQYIDHQFNERIVPFMRLFAENVPDVGKTYDAHERRISALEYEVKDLGTVVGRLMKDA